MLLELIIRGTNSRWRYDSEARLLLHTYARASVKRRSASQLKQPSLLHVKKFRTKSSHENFRKKSRENRPDSTRSFGPVLVACTKHLSPPSCRSDSLVISDGAKSARGARVERAPPASKSNQCSRVSASERAVGGRPRPSARQTHLLLHTVRKSAFTCWARAKPYDNF